MNSSDSVAAILFLGETPVLARTFLIKNFSDVFDSNNQFIVKCTFLSSENFILYLLHFLEANVVVRSADLIHVGFIPKIR